MYDRLKHFIIIDKEPTKNLFIIIIRRKGHLEKKKCKLANEEHYHAFA